MHYLHRQSAYKSGQFEASASRIQEQFNQVQELMTELLFVSCRDSLYVRVVHAVPMCGSEWSQLHLLISHEDISNQHSH